MGEGLGKGASVGNDLGSVDAIGTRERLFVNVYIKQSSLGRGLKANAKG